MIPAFSSKKTWCGNASSIDADQSSLLELLRGTFEAETGHEGKVLDLLSPTPVEATAEGIEKVRRGQVYNILMGSGIIVIPSWYLWLGR